MTSDKVAGGGTARHEVLNEPVTTADSCYLWSLMVFRLRRAVRVAVRVGMELPHNQYLGPGAPLRRRGGSHRDGA